jgi:hypothetical protein
MIAIVAITCATSVLCYLTAASAESMKCAGRVWLVNYRSGVSDFLAFPIFGAICLGLVAAIPVLLKRKSRSALFDAADSIVVFEFLSMRIGYGMFGFVAGLASFVFILGMGIRYCAVRYIEISNYCQSVSGSN